MGLFGPIGACRLLRRATRQSLAIPVLSFPIDCTHGTQDLPTEYLPPIAPQPTDRLSNDDTPQFPMAIIEDSARLKPAGYPSDILAAVDEKAAAAIEVGGERLRRLLEIVACQEPGLRWAAGDRQDGTTVVTTDIGEGRVPPGIAARRVANAGGSIN